MTRAPSLVFAAALLCAGAAAAADPLCRLLDGAYRAYALTGEAAIWDGLAAVAVEPALTALYLARQRALLAHDGAPATVEIVEVVLESAGPPDADGRRRAVWRVLGLLGHLGHRHGLLNRYEAELTLVETADGPRLGALSLLRAERADLGLGHTE